MFKGKINIKIETSSSERCHTKKEEHEKKMRRICGNIDKNEEAWLSYRPIKRKHHTKTKI